MKISGFFLCDYAQARGNMLTVVSAGISRVIAGHPVSIYAAGFMVDEAGSDPRVHEVRLTLLDEDFQTLGAGAGTLQITASPERMPGEELQLPFVLPVPQFVPQAGRRYDVRLAVDDLTEVLSFWALDAQAVGH